MSKNTLLIEVPKAASAGDFLVIEDGQVVRLLKSHPLTNPGKASSTPTPTKPEKKSSKKLNKLRQLNGLADKVKEAVERQPGLSPSQVAESIQVPVRKVRPTLVRLHERGVIDRGRPVPQKSKLAMGARNFWTYFPKNYEGPKSGGMNP